MTWHNRYSGAPVVLIETTPTTVTFRRKFDTWDVTVPHDKFMMWYKEIAGMVAYKTKCGGCGGEHHLNLCPYSGVVVALGSAGRISSREGIQPLYQAAHDGVTRLFVLTESGAGLYINPQTMCVI